MTDATILIPTFRHVPLVPYSVRSALDQVGVSVEVFVVGDGVEDATREVLEPFADDLSFRFFDFPKSPRHGEPYRHEVLQEAAGGIVCYVSDDDLLLPDHAAEMSWMLEDADFAHGPAVSFDAAGTMHYHPFDMGHSAFVELARGGGSSIGLTGVAHTLEAYRRLPYGWRTTPPGIYSDHYMWLQWLDLPGLRAVRGRKLTHLEFPDPLWGKIDEAARAEALADWFRRSRDPGFPAELDVLLLDATRHAAGTHYLHEKRLEREVKRLEREVAEARAGLLGRLRRARPLRTLFARRRAAR
jgi:GalNAc5-diNAcBac-PP-undecaprenol beta-1,3-glucosyltransferase